MKLLVDKTFQSWRAKVDDGKSAERKSLPAALSRSWRRPRTTAPTTRRNRWSGTSRRHFDEKVRAGVVGKAAASRQAGQPEEADWPITRATRFRASWS